MGFRETYQKRRDSLNQRHSEQVEKGEGSGQYSSVFITDKIPKEIGFWTCSEGRHIVDIIPFLAANTIPFSETPEGELEYRVDHWVHRDVGPIKQSFVCPTMTWNKPCPICEYLKKHGREHSKEEYLAMKSKRRVAYLVWVHDTPVDEQKGIQIWEIAHWFFQDKISELALSARGGGAIPFYDINEGKSIVWTRRGKGSDNTHFLAHKFEDRLEPIPDEICDMSFALDSAIKLRPTYEEIDKAFYADNSGERQEQEPEQEPVVESPPSRIKQREITPEKKQPAAGYKPEPKKEERVDKAKESFEGETLKAGECPEGGTFGKDVDKFTACRRNCPLYDDCDSLNETLAGKGKEKTKPEETQKSEPQKTASETSQPPKRIIRRK